MIRALPLTRAQAVALRARLRTALGLPRAATEADRVGGGIHVPLELAATTEALELFDLLDGSLEALVPPELEARLTAGERTRLRDATPSPESPALAAEASPDAPDAKG